MNKKSLYSIKQNKISHENFSFHKQRSATSISDIQLSFLTLVEESMISIQLRNLNTSTNSPEITVMNAFAFVSILTFSKVTDAFYSCLSFHMNMRSVRNVNAPNNKGTASWGFRNLWCKTAHGDDLMEQAMELTTKVQFGKAQSTQLQLEKQLSSAFTYRGCAFNLRYIQICILRNVSQILQWEINWSHTNQVINRDTPNKNFKYLWY